MHKAPVCVVTARLSGLMEFDETRVDFYLSFKVLEREEKIQIFVLLFWEID